MKTAKLVRPIYDVRVQPLRRDDQLRRWIERGVYHTLEASLDCYRTIEVAMMAASELADNIVVHGDWSHPTAPTMRVWIAQEPVPMICMSFANPVSEPQQTFERVQSHIEKTRTPEDAMRAVRDRVRAMRFEKIGKRDGGLGLLNLGLEGLCKLSAELDEHDILRIEARITVGEAENLLN